MLALLWLVIFIAAFIALAYARARLRTATGLIGVLLAVCTVTSCGWLTALILWVVFGAIAVTLHVGQVRRTLITAPALNLFRRVLPTLSATERTALDAGTVWWEGELFSGRPDWRRLENLPGAELTAEEQAFLDGPVQTLLDMCDEWQITHEDADLPAEAWQYIKDNRFWGMIIPRQYGGLAFSAYAHSCVLAKIGSGPAGGTVGPIVAVPNSLGPAELLMHYGTGAQKDHYLPRLALGDEIPCFGLTSPHAGSDAGAIPDRGIICHGEWQGEQVLGMRLTWDKRYITLCPVATVLGLAFKLYDPDGLLGTERELGVTCALIPTDTPGCHTGRRHFPASAPFQNGPTWGEDVFVPLDMIIGGQQMIGQGWRMLMECLSVGRAISLPSGSTGDAISNARHTGAYAVIRRQFNVSIGAFEGVQEALARIGGKTYACESVRRFTANAVDLGEKPSVSSAIAKFHVTTMAQDVAKDAMDVHAGKAVMLGPSNPVARSFQAAPVNITVEGANILTRSMMIFGQGAIRCHPFVLAEIEAANNRDQEAALTDFDDLLYAHIGHDLGAAARSLVMGFTGGLGSAVGEHGDLKPFYQAMNRYSANLALLSDIAMATLGGSLKFRESLSARLGDVLSQLYIVSATLKRFVEDGAHAEDRPYVAWVCEQAFADIETALSGVLRHLPNRVAAAIARVLIFPLGRTARVPSDHLGRRVARLVQTPGAARDRLTPRCYLSATKTDTGLTLFERAMQATLDTAEPMRDVIKARKAGTIIADHPADQIDEAETAGVLSAEDAARLREAHALQMAVIRVDDFDPTDMRAGRASPATDGAENAA
ncbi:acyl-CoA dehydrogenase [Salinisphaera sp. Q1T1-3]|uniref:acyl-CoA dehydrogenase n=1 Tax=Salinisphaera sp. Q1T1-3 TaxID=2321229 RepID=UPI000E75F608|nr:acyl-CoA dehydrogenase [Salinisphaera sp. Q1T1-3]RJS94376.1 acyl-CoA dehydrogenase [Salinisphaera sp. Q1T1-3]